MDTPKIGPLTPIGNLLKNVSRVLLDPDWKPVVTTKPGGKTEAESIKNTNVQAPAQEMAVKDETFESLESMLPIKILANPMLKGSEWAWKRLITSILENSSFSVGTQNKSEENSNQGINPEIFSAGADVRNLAKGEDLQPLTNSKIQEATAQMKTAILETVENMSTASTIKSGGAEARIEDSLHSVSQNENTSIQASHENVLATVMESASSQASNHAANISIEQSFTPIINDIRQIFDATATMSMGQSGSMQESVVSDIHQEPNATIQPQTGMKLHTGTNQEGESSLAPSSGVGSQYHEAIKMLWSILTVASSQSNRDVAKAEIRGLQDKGPLIQFSSLNHAEFKGELPQTVQQWVIEDRLTASVQFDAYERFGQGIFFPPGQSPGRARQAVRWQAKKQTKVTSQGKLIHRIQLDLKVNNQPVKCTIISAKPSLVVHFDTNDIHLQKHLSMGQSAIERTLGMAGWHLEKWSVSAYDDGVEME